MSGEVKYYKSVCFEGGEEYTELAINETNQRILVNHGELVIYLLNYNKKVPIEIKQITPYEHSVFFASDNYFGLDWIDNKLTDLRIKEVSKEK